MLGGDLRRARQDKNLTLEDLAGRTGLHPTSIQKIESGAHEPRAKTVMVLAKGLGVKPGDLLDGEAWHRLFADAE